MPFPVSFLPQIAQRLTLRRFAHSDLARFLAYRHDPQIARFQGWSMLSYNEAQSFISEMRTVEIGILGEWFQIAIAHKQSNLLLGDIGMKIYAENPTIVEIGFTLGRKEQGKGYAQEAVQALINSLFEFGNIDKIVGITDMRNQPSVNLLIRLGMNLVRSDEVEFKGELCIEQTFEIGRKDWLLSQKIR
jgi:RimJ/RimL family protein N-acetyltransferase